MVVWLVGACTLGTEPQFRIGQEWAYQTRTHEPKSTLIVGAIEKYSKLDTVIHISVNNLQVVNPQSDGQFSTQIDHLPMLEAALSGSVTELISEGADTTQVLEGLILWEESDGGAFSENVAETIQIVEESLSNIGPSNGSPE